MILISPTAFKGTLRPLQAAIVIAKTIQKIRAGLIVQICPLADGGDGTFEVLATQLQIKQKVTRVRGPLGKPVMARWGIINGNTFLKGKTAVIEMARASGLALVKGRKRPLEATSYGTGQLIKAALDADCRNILIGVGGTAASDGGAGALQALGLRYFGKRKRELSAAPSKLYQLERVDWAHFDTRLRSTRILVLCDVKNPLLGPRGSAKTFSPQKGARPAQVLFIEKFLSSWSRFAKVRTQDKPGAGAAGALAFGLSGFAGAKLVDGAEFIMKILKWKDLAKKADVIVTGEGKIDQTSFEGKVIGAIVKNRGRARVLVVCGSTSLTRSFLNKKGIEAVEQMGPSGLKHPTAALVRATHHLFKNFVT